MRTRIVFQTRVTGVRREKRVVRTWRNDDGTVGSLEEDLGWFMFLEGSHEGLHIGMDEQTSIQADQPATVTVEVG